MGAFSDGNEKLSITARCDHAGVHHSEQLEMGDDAAAYEAGRVARELGAQIEYYEIQFSGTLIMARSASNRGDIKLSKHPRRRRTHHASDWAMRKLRGARYESELHRTIDPQLKRLSLFTRIVGAICVHE